MVKPASFDKNGMKSGIWSEEEDNKLRNCINQFGHPNWRLLPLVAGLKRCGKSCRLRWVNYLKPGLRRGKFTKDEERLIIELHNQLGNKWSAITEYFPGRTDNDIKNYWHAHIQKRGGRVSRAVRMRNMAPEEQSSDSINSSITTSGVNQEMTHAASEVAFFDQAAENMGVFESNADSDYNAAALYDQTWFNNLENIDDQNNFVNVEEFDGFGENMLSAFCDIDSSQWGINASWNNLMSDATILPQPDLWSTEPVGEDFFNNIQFW